MANISKLSFVTGSDISIDSMTLQVQAMTSTNNSQNSSYVAGIRFQNGQWLITCVTSTHEVVDMTWEDFALIFSKFSTFIAVESAIMINDERKLNKDLSEDE